MKYTLVQAVMMPIYVYTFTFHFDFGLTGLWFAKSIVDASLLACFNYILFSADWNEISLQSIKRQMKDNPDSYRSAIDKNQMTSQE